MRFRLLLLIPILTIGMHGAAKAVTAPQITTEPQAYDQPPVPTSPLIQVTGIASWYGRTGKGHYGEPTVAWYTRKTKWGDPVTFYAAAGPSLRDALGDDNPYHDHYPVQVTNPRTGITITVVVVDWCGCSSGTDHEKMIDLSPAAFQALGVHLTRGIQRVIVTLPTPAP